MSEVAEIKMLSFAWERATQARLRRSEQIQRMDSEYEGGRRVEIAGRESRGGPKKRFMHKVEKVREKRMRRTGLDGDR